MASTSTTLAGVPLVRIAGATADRCWFLAAMDEVSVLHALASTLTLVIDPGEADLTALGFRLLALEVLTVFQALAPARALLPRFLGVGVAFVAARWWLGMPAPEFISFLQALATACALLERIIGVRVAPVTASRLRLLAFISVSVSLTSAASSAFLFSAVASIITRLAACGWRLSSLADLLAEGIVVLAFVAV